MKTETKNWWEDEQESREFFAWLVLEGKNDTDTLAVTRGWPGAFRNEYAAYQAAKAKEAEQAKPQYAEVVEWPDVTRSGVWLDLDSRRAYFATEGRLQTGDGGDLYDDYEKCRGDRDARYTDCRRWVYIGPIPEIEPEPELPEPLGQVLASCSLRGYQDKRVWWVLASSEKHFLSMELDDSHFISPKNLAVIPHEANDPELVRLIEEAGVQS